MEELKNLMTEIGEKPFRAKQIYAWLHQQLVTSWDEMTNLSKSLREKLSVYPITALTQADVRISKIDETRKYLFQLEDGNVIESVLMRYHHGNSVCISSQVGCRMGCRFCASTLDGLERNLTPGEMLDQIYAITRYTGERVSNVVVMGTGEPMDNYDNLLYSLWSKNADHRPLRRSIIRWFRTGCSFRLLHRCSSNRYLRYHAEKDEPDVRTKKD